jgi:hypothetical protein
MLRPSYRMRAFRMPVSRSRLYGAVLSAAFFSFLLYFASVNLGWFTLNTEYFLLLGVAEGLVVGLYEASAVTKELAKKAETTVWLTLPLFPLCMLPLLWIFVLYGTYALLPYAAYLILPFLPAYEAASGWRYSKFEKEHKVQVFTISHFGFKYWTEPVDLSPRFGLFIDSVISKDFSGIIYQAAYSQKFIAYMKGRSKIERPTKDFLSKILDIVDTYGRRSRRIGWMFIMSMVALMIYFFELVATNAFGLEKVVDGVIVEGQAITLILGIVPFATVFGGFFAAMLLLRRRYKKRISTVLTSLNPEILSNLRSIIET